MKKSLKIAFLFFASIFFVFTIVQYVAELMNADFLSYQPAWHIIDTSIRLIPMIFLGATIIILFLADIINRKIKFEKSLYIVSATLFAPNIVISMVKFINAINIKSSDILQQIISLGIMLFGFLILVSIFIFLITKVFYKRKTKSFVLVTFGFSYASYIILTVFSSIKDNSLETIGLSVSICIITLIPILGLMTKDRQSHFDQV